MTTDETVQSMMIEEGFVTKRGPRPLRIWQKRYFRLPTANQSYPLNRLRLVYRKNAKKTTAPREEFEKTNQLLLETLASATVDASRILAYFKSDDKEETPQGFINFNHVTEVDPSPKIKPFAFTVKTKSREYVFSTTSQKDTDSWVATLKNLASQEPIDSSDTAAYKFSYEQLAERKGFASPSVPAQDDEVFSASEAENETKEAAPVAQPTEEAIDPSAEAIVDAVPDAASPRKSFYTEVIDFFHRKIPESEAKVEAVDPIAEAKEDQEVKEDGKDSEFSKEIAEMVAPISSDPPSLEPSPVAAADETPAEAQTEAKPSRSKTFNMPKFEGKIFSKLFNKKGGSDDEAQKETTDEAPKQDVAPEAVEAATEESTTEEQPTSEAKHDLPVAHAIEEPSAGVEIAKEESNAIAPEVVEEPAQEEAPVTPTKEEKKPFLTRLLSSGRKKAEEPKEAATEAADLEAEASAPVEVEASEVKRPFIKRLLSGNLKNKAETASVQEAHTESTEPAEAVVEAASEPVDESVVIVAEPEAVVAEPAQEKAEEVATEEPTEAPAAQRQASLITRIGELAYSAVAPAPATIPEGAEELSEHYVEKSKDAAHSGFLFKQSTLLHTNNLRYVILSKDGAFTYYRSAQVPSEGKKIQIDDTVQVGPVDELILSIKPANAYAMLFQAKDREDRDKWGAALAQFSHVATKEEVEQAVAEVLSLDKSLDAPIDTPTELPAEASQEAPAEEKKDETPLAQAAEPSA
ncbi:hypothetical protein DSO57_1002484 [Entomophthora muscae]|uniref:Uncharacterized protein n=1 Tax=Entomophthora muscae TaxID=34485 RepID=A0ACC2TWE3_9FUNG|nr:hypothetical protein DSO57_1002484 [Entomophthora muscae]